MNYAPNILLKTLGFFTAGVISLSVGTASAAELQLSDLLKFDASYAQNVSAEAEGEAPNVFSVYLADETAETVVSVNGQGNAFDLYQQSYSMLTASINGDFNQAKIHAGVGAEVGLEVVGRSNFIDLTVLAGNSVSGSVQGVGNSIIIRQ